MLKTNFMLPGLKFALILMTLVFVLQVDDYSSISMHYSSDASETGEVVAGNEVTNVSCKTDEHVE
jgi:hypothetical protein